MSGGNKPYLCSEDETLLSQWAYDRYDQLNTVRTNEVIREAYDLQRKRMEIAIKLLTPCHGRLAHKVKKN